MRGSSKITRFMGGLLGSGQLLLVDSGMYSYTIRKGLRVLLFFGGEVDVETPATSCRGLRFAIVIKSTPRIKGSGAGRQL